jgi:5-hydroxyisourate hydrolase-like protein (transthyretin family)
VRVDYLKVTSDTVLVPITIQVPNRELTFIAKDGVQRGLVNIFARMSTITGKTAQTFEDTLRLDIPSGLFDKALSNVALYWKALPMRPGRYRLDIVLKDLNGDKLGTVVQGIQVPGYSEDKLSSSSLILADVLEPVPRSEVGSGDFVLGPDIVRPKVQTAGKPVSFRRDQNIGVWMQVYHLALDENTGKPAATVEYEVVNTGTNQQAIILKDNAGQAGALDGQLTLEKRLSLANLTPGEYQLTVKVTDLVLGEVIRSAARFVIE